MGAYPRAFLSHSSEDKPLVSEVAALLGRARVAYDSQTFKPGEDFRLAIREALRDSTLFVFFVSRASLDSVWCGFELDQAEYLQIQDGSRSALALIIDEEVSVHDLPDWLQRLKAIPVRGAHQAARAIERRISAALSTELQNPFVNRIRDIERGTRKLALDEPPPRILIVSGLEGVGRRSFLKRLVGDVLNIDLAPTFIIDQSHNLEDLYVAVGEEALSPLSREDLAKDLQAFRALDSASQADEAARRLLLLTEYSQAPCLVDRGGMLNARGDYKDEYQLLLDAFLANGGNDSYLAIVHNRTPGSNDSFSPPALHRRLAPLELVDAKVLLSQLLRNAGIDRKSDVLTPIAEATGGYPPAIYFAASQIEMYGVDVVASNQSMLIDFHARNFLPFIQGLNLGEEESRVLEFLASEATLPIRAVAAATDIPLDETALVIARLIDQNLLELINDDYAIANPIRTAVARTFDKIDKKWYEGAFKRIEEVYWSDPKVAPPISVVDATLRTAVRIGRHGVAAYGDVIRPSLLIYGAEQMYHQREYEAALDYAERAALMGATANALDEIVIKSSARLGRFVDARNRLRQYRDTSDRRYWYLKGFVARKQNLHREACDSFQKGYAKGDRTVSLLRDYADSLWRVGDVEAGREMAALALRRDASNVFVLDLVARMNIDSGTLEEAEQALNALEAADVHGLFIHHRRAYYLLRRIRTREATIEAVRLSDIACSIADAPAEAYLVRANALIEAGRFDAFDSAIRDIERKFGGDPRKNDLVRGLRCKAAIRQNRWRSAETLWSGLRDQRRPVHRAMRARMLEMKAVDPAVLLHEREEASSQAATIRRGLEDGVESDLVLVEEAANED